MNFDIDRWSLAHRSMPILRYRGRSAKNQSVFIEIIRKIFIINIFGGFCPCDRIIGPSFSVII